MQRSVVDFDPMAMNPFELGHRSSTLVGEKGVFWAAFWHRGLEKSIVGPEFSPSL